MAATALGQAVDVDTGRVLYTMQITEGYGSQVAKKAAFFGYEVIDFFVRFTEPDRHTLIFYLRKKR